MQQFSDFEPSPQVEWTIYYISYSINFAGPLSFSYPKNQSPLCLYYRNHHVYIAFMSAIFQVINGRNNGWYLHWHWGYHINDIFALYCRGDVVWIPNSVVCYALISLIFLPLCRHVQWSREAAIVDIPSINTLFNKLNWFESILKSFVYVLRFMLFNSKFTTH